MTEVKKNTQGLNPDAQKLSLEELDRVIGGSTGSLAFATLVKICYNGCGSQAEYDSVKTLYQKMNPNYASDKDYMAVDKYFQGLLDSKGQIVNDDAEMIMKKHNSAGVLEM